MKANRTVSLLISALAMILLILDGKTAVNSARQGLDMCIRSVIPSLFPFFFLSVIINDGLLGAQYKLLRPLSRICKIPEGSEPILLLGLIGGYPVGGASISAAYKDNLLSKGQATRMLAFCNNAGPSFIFGMLATIFEDPIVLWVLWAILIFSALSVGVLLPGDGQGSISLIHKPTTTPSKTMLLALRNITLVCGWVILFRIIFGFLSRWFLWLLPKESQIFLCGLLELSNGCLSLSLIPSSGLRFLFSTIFLSFGGLCVVMQTASILGDLPIKTYCIGKCLQTAIATLFAGVAQLVLFPQDHIKPSIVSTYGAILLIFILIWKLAVAFHGNIGYNGKKSLQK